ncbi:MAG: 16S rRNA processing protein RimM [Armatimonadetes bacterium]|nr:16S rRNA processing protein RimM [Armatimonadota bacterium]
MTLKREVLVKAIVTEKLKNDLKQGVENALKELAATQEEIERQYRRLMLELQRTDLNRAMAVRQQIDAERRRQEEARRELEERLKEYDQLEMDTEIPLATYEGLVEIQPGDNLMEKMRGAEILLKDDIIQEFREL